VGNRNVNWNHELLELDERLAGEEDGLEPAEEREEMEEERRANELLELDGAVVLALLDVAAAVEVAAAVLEAGLPVDETAADELAIDTAEDEDEDDIAIGAASV
jgi:hypothetical protein